MWFKDGKTLRSGARVRHLSTEHIRITSIVKEDKGMYQCILKNDLESSQCSAELRLGGMYLTDEVLVAKFYIQNMEHLRHIFTVGFISKKNICYKADGS